MRVHRSRVSVSFSERLQNISAVIFRSLELHQDIDRDFLLDGITNEFKILPDNVQLTDVDVNNYRSATDSTVRPQVERQLLTEIEQRNYVITTDTELTNQLLLAPLGQYRNETPMTFVLFMTAVDPTRQA